MMQKQIFFMVVIASTAISVLYLLWGFLLVPILRERQKVRYTDQRISYLIKFIVMLLCPVVGPLFFAVGQLLYFTLFQQDADLEDVIFSKERVATHLHPDEERERNMVPLEEAIAVSDKASLRTLMMNIVKGDIEKSLSAIALALNSEDSETSHYAASVLRDELNEFRVNARKVYEEIKKEDPGQTEYEHILIPYMNRVLEQKVFTGMEQESFVHLLDEAGEILYRKEKAQITSRYYEWICLRLLEIRDFSRMEEWCRRAAKAYPMELSTYTCQLKLYFTKQEKENFFRVLDELKKSNITIDRETLELIRIFS